MEPDLDRLLPLIDDDSIGTDVETVEAQARVWARLSGGVALERDSPPGRSGSRWLLASAAALVLALTGALAFVVGIDDPDEVPSDEVSVPTTRLDLDAACERFRTAAVPLEELDDDLETPAALDVLRMTLDELDALIAELTADRSVAVIDESDVETLLQVRGGLQQAVLHLERGETSSARAAIEFARRADADSELGESGCLG